MDRQEITRSIIDCVRKNYPSKIAEEFESKIEPDTTDTCLLYVLKEIKNCYNKRKEK